MGRKSILGQSVCPFVMHQERSPKINTTYHISTICIVEIIHLPVVTDDLQDRQRKKIHQLCPAEQRQPPQQRRSTHPQWHNGITFRVGSFKLHEHDQGFITHIAGHSQVDGSFGGVEALEFSFNKFGAVGVQSEKHPIVDLPWFKGVAAGIFGDKVGWGDGCCGP
jgi:hypothetical protein